MNSPIAFHPAYRAHVIDDDTIALRSERGPEVLSGPGLGTLAGLIDGRRTAEAIVARAPRRLDAPTAYFMLEDLAERGFVVSDDSLGAPEAEAAPRHVRTLARVLSRVLPVRPAVRHASGVRTRWTGRAWPDTPVWRPGAAHEREARSLDVIVVDDYLRGDLARVNGAALDAKRRWIPVQPWGEIVWIGPLFEPGSGPCWECLAQRLRGHRVVESWLARRDGRWPDPVPLMGTPASAEGVVARLVAHAAALTCRTVTPLRAHLLTIDLVNGRWSAHAVVRRPQCAACGSVRRPASGATRSRTVQNPFADLTDPLTGVIEDVSLVARPSWPSVRLAMAPAATQWVSQSFARAWRSQVEPSSGKGFTRAEAMRSAAGEAVERYCGEFDGTEPRITGSLRALGTRAIDPRRCLLFSDAQYASWRPGLHASDGGHTAVPRPFDAGASMEWSPVWSLTHRCERYLPTAYLYYGHPDSARLGMCRADSNGCAAGTTSAHALYRGLLELIERDAVAIWWYNCVRRPQAPMARLLAPRTRGLVRDCRRDGRRTWLLDLTNDVGVPVYAALSARRRGLPRIAFGFGADLDPRQAATRAMAEMGQVLATTQGAGVDEDTLAPAITDWLRRGTLRSEAYVVPKGRVGARTDKRPPSSAAAVRELRRRLELRGLEVLCLSQTRPDVRVPVMRAIVPGLRHFWPRFAPGRLFDVPVALGWRELPTPESALNPTAFFL